MQDQLISFLSGSIGAQAAFAVSLIFVVTPIALTLWDIWRKNRLTRSDYVIRSYQDFMKDPEMLDIFYRIDYNFLESSDLILGSDEEKALDKLLGHFNNIGHLFRKGILNMEDADFISYQTLKIYNNRAVADYLNSFQGYASLHRTYDDFTWFAQKLEKKQRALHSKKVSEKWDKTTKKTAIA